MVNNFPYYEVRHPYGEIISIPSDPKEQHRQSIESMRALFAKQVATYHKKADAEILKIINQESASK